MNQNNLDVNQKIVILSLQDFLKNKQKKALLLLAQICGLNTQCDNYFKNSAFNQSLKLIIKDIYLISNFEHLLVCAELKKNHTCCCCCLVTQSCLTLRPHGLQPTRLLCPWGFSRQEHWSGLPCPPPGDLPNPGIEPGSPALQTDSLPLSHQESPKTTPTEE